MQNNTSICPVCEEFSFEFPDDYDICPVCGWENDGVQRAKKDFWGGANSLSVNESRTVFLLLKNDMTKGKISEILDRFKQRNSEIHIEFRNINHRTAEGEKCRNAFAKAHSDFVIELNKLSLNISQ